MNTMMQTPPIAHPQTRMVRSAAMNGLAVQFTGDNAAELKTVCNHSPGPGFDAGFVDGTEIVMGQPVARVYDARTRSWPTVPVGDWVVASCEGVLVLPDTWFRALFADHAELESDSWFSDGRGFTLSFDAQPVVPWGRQALREVPTPWIPQAG